MKNFSFFQTKHVDIFSPSFVKAKSPTTENREIDFEFFEVKILFKRKSIFRGVGSKGHAALIRGRSLCID